jgi:hypothetical protein
MKHKHYEMIVAKAANMDLVVLIKSKTTNRWEAMELSCIPSFYEESEYFLCLPQHKEACLHWLNGGEVEENYNSRWDKVEQHSWHGQSVFNFDDGYIIRIKPKKEKRWIATCKGWNASQKVFRSREEAVDLLGSDCYQFHEIEVEV